MKAIFRLSVGALATIAVSASWPANAQLQTHGFTVGSPTGGAHAPEKPRKLTRAECVKKASDQKLNGPKRTSFVRLCLAGDAKLAEYLEDLASAQSQAARDPASPLAQRSVALSDDTVAGTLANLHMYEDALSYDQDAVAIFENLAKRDENDQSAQVALARSLFGGVGDDLYDLGRVDEAFVNYDRALAIQRRLADAHPEDASLRADVAESAGKMGRSAFDLIRKHEFQKSLDAVDHALAAAPDLLWLQTYRAHALMFLGRIDEAHKIYLDHRGQKTRDDDLWEVVVRQDFAELRKAGLTNPLMDDVEKQFDQAK